MCKYQKQIYSEIDANNDWGLERVVESERIDINAAASYAARMGRLRCLEVLDKYKKDINAPDEYGNTPAHFAAEEGHIDCLEFLAKHTKADLNAPNQRGETPADLVASTGQVKCMEFLNSLKQE